jgi:4-hydroxy-tetrahydrodipicolinate synthase
MNKAVYYCPAVTCFDRDRELDLEAQTNVYRHVLAGSIEGFIVMGSIGEFIYMSPEQKRQLADLAIAELKGKARVIIGTGGTRLQEVVDFSNEVLDKGADAVIIVAPYYFGLTPSELERYYDLCAENIHGDIFLYNFPAATGGDISPDLLVRLLKKHKNIAGLKDTVPGFPHTRQLIDAVRPDFPDFVVLQGYDDNFFHSAFSGGNGCIGGLSNLYPEVAAAAAKAFNAGDFAECARLQKKLNKLFQLYAISDPFHPVMKRAMMLRGVAMQPYCCEPMPLATEEQTEKIKALLAEVDAM